MNATTTYSVEVDKRSKKAMATYLAEHFRYDTMNSWNRLGSYAHNVKVNQFVPRDLLSNAYDIVFAEDGMNEINELIREWDRDHDYQYQLGFNGRSGGYLVLYTGGWKPSQYKRQCFSCGQLNYKAESIKCGRCGSDNMHDYSGRDIYTNSTGLDDEESFETFMEWDIESLRDRVELIQEFDAFTDTLAAVFIDICEEYEVVEETIMVPRTIQVLQAK